MSQENKQRLKDDQNNYHKATKEAQKIFFCFVFIQYKNGTKSLFGEDCMIKFLS